MKIRTERIEWDTDDCKETFNALPQVVEIEVEDEEEIADALSDEYGFCIFTLSYDVIGGDA